MQNALPVDKKNKCMRDVAISRTENYQSEENMKIWAKTLVDDKITRNIVDECEFLANDYLFGEELRNICEKLDIPTPISTVTNYIHFVRFNMTRYQKRDFVESVDFDYLTIECIPEDK